MTTLLYTLLNDEAGFVVSAELVLVATIAVLAMLVGLTEVSYGVNEELEDVGSAYGSINQGYRYNGVIGFKGRINGSLYNDEWDDCDTPYDITCERSRPRGESY